MVQHFFKTCETRNILLVDVLNIFNTLLPLNLYKMCFKMASIKYIISIKSASVARWLASRLQKLEARAKLRFEL